MPLTDPVIAETIQPIDIIAAPARRVLVVDNDAAVLTAMQALLSGWGFVVQAAADSDTARRLCHRARPHLPVLDDHPDGGATGLNLRAQLGEAIATLSCIVVTADHSEDVRRAAAAAGCHLLHKPLALKSRMGQLLTRSDAIV
ncbi:MAG: response regulator [Dokdonella sp.]